MNIAPVSGRAVTWSDTGGIGVRVYKQGSANFVHLSCTD